MRAWFAGWLARPHRTNRDALTVAIVGGVVVFGVLAGGGKLLDLVGLVEFRGSVSVGIAAILVAAALLTGIIVGGLLRPKRSELQEQINAVEARTAEVETYDVYAEHIGEVLADLRKVLDGVVAPMSFYDLIEKGVFEPAHRLLTRDGGRGDVRFSMLVPVDGDFVMMLEGELLPALGHSIEGRSRFRMPIDESFAGLAFRSGEAIGSGDVENDQRFKPHPRASRPYSSIYAVPLRSGDEIEWVLCLVATEKDAFDAIDRTYIRLLASVIEVSRSAVAALVEARTSG